MTFGKNDIWQNDIWQNDIWQNENWQNETQQYKISMTIRKKTHKIMTSRLHFVE